MKPTSQRVDISKLVESHVAEEEADDPSQMYESVRPGRAMEASRAVPRKPAPDPGFESLGPTGDPYYVVVDEIVEGTVTFEAWPWPGIDSATRYLSFDLDKTVRKTLDLATLQERVNTLRAALDLSAGANRPLRVGDVFDVEATNVRDMSTWLSVVDDTQRKRREARAALDAMAAPPHFEGAAELEEIARTPTDREKRPDSASRAHPVV